MASATPIPAPPAPRRGLAALAGAVIAVAAVAQVRRYRAQAPDAAALPPTAFAARRVRQAAAILSTSVLADSTLEHSRADFHKRPMYAAPTLAAAALAASAGDRIRRPGLRELAYAGAVGGGLAGTFYHLRNVVERPAGISWLNLFYGAPVGAPAALSLAGLYGLAADALERSGPAGAPPAGFGRGLALLSAGGLVGTSMEAALLHFRGAYQDPFMLVPVVLPPLAALALASAAAAPGRERVRTARRLAGATALAGVAGAGFHAYGIHRNMGGWADASLNVFQGPPLPAPPAFTGIALAGLGALRLIELEIGTGGPR